MKKITLIRTMEGWMATFHGDQSVIDAFGTDTIPTPYTAQAEAAVVVNAIRRLNPTCQVEIPGSYY